MSGRAIILVVAGIIIISGIIMHRIEAASSAIVQNYADYYIRQSTQNLAQAGVNISLRKLAWDRIWTAGLGDANNPVALLDGRCYTKIDPGINYRGLSAIRITSVGISQYGTHLERRDTSVGYAYFPAASIPPAVKGLITLNSSNSTSGSIKIDGRDFDTFSTTVNPGQGTYGVWTTGSTFTVGINGGVGGTNTSAVDFAPPFSGVADPSIIALGQVYSPGFPDTPDSAFGGSAAGYPEGTLMSVAKSGVDGSQYVTNPARLKQPLRGVTYVDLPSGGIWNSAYLDEGSRGILVVHNAARNASIRDIYGDFAGIIVADDIARFHATFWGAIIGLTAAPSGNVVGNTGCTIRFSRQAILNATSMLSNGAQPHIAGWYE